MMLVSASLFERTFVVQFERYSNSGGREIVVDDVQGTTSRTVFGPFQLESLILAQNERWRQA